MDYFTYVGDRSNEISFPLGGIGSGSIGLGGNGRLMDWEIFNRPNIGSVNEFTHFALKAEADGKVIDARVLNGDLPAPYTGNLARQFSRGFGWGPSRSYMSGVPHFEHCTFTGTYPVATLDFSDDNFPATVSMTAFNPFIPLNEDDSSIPGAFFEITIQNTSALTVDYTAALSLGNPFDKETGVCAFSKDNGVKQMFITSKKHDNNHPKFGDITAATDADEVSYQEYWVRGRWFDNLTTFWKDFTAFGKLKNRTYHEPNLGGDVYTGADMSTLAAHVTLKAGETKRMKFIIAWNVPNCYNYLNPEFYEGDLSPVQKLALGTDVNSIVGEFDPRSTVWKNYYAKLWADSRASSQYALKNWDRLYAETMQFTNALMDSTMPVSVLDAITANLSTLKSPTCLRLEDGQLYGWEGCNVTVGSCEGSCSHVWNYAYSVPFLFPKLERSMRDLEYTYNLWDDGMMSFRLQLPLGREKWGFIPCVDGQFGTVMRVYRDWKMSGDSQWLKTLWPGVKKSIEFAWSPENKQRWDFDKDGVLEGSQHHTLDVELYGPNSWLTGFYLGALKAGSEMAEHLGDGEAAKEYLQLFEKGSRWVDDNLFNGEYFHQKIDMRDQSILDPYKDEKTLKGDTVYGAYWNVEQDELKYQIGDGCIIDQVIAQWHANISGLGQIFDKEKVESALGAIYRYNHKKSVRNFFNPCRVYALNDEAATIVCEWPEGKYKPKVPIVYSEESFLGCEYAVAAHMIQEGLLEEGFDIVKGLRDRFDGKKRNPWNEIECGSHYSRSMASYALLPALSGYSFDMVNKSIGFNPAYREDGRFQCFWSTSSAWGTFLLEGNAVNLDVQYGAQSLKILRLGFANQVDKISVDGRDIAFAFADHTISFAEEIVIPRDASLVISWS